MVRISEFLDIADGLVVFRVHAALASEELPEHLECVDDNEPGEFVRVKPVVDEVNAANVLSRDLSNDV